MLENSQFVVEALGIVRRATTASLLSKDWGLYYPTTLSLREIRKERTVCRELSSQRPGRGEYLDPLSQMIEVARKGGDSSTMWSRPSTLRIFGARVHYL